MHHTLGSWSTESTLRCCNNQHVRACVQINGYSRNHAEATVAQKMFHAHRSSRSSASTCVMSCKPAKSCCCWSSRWCRDTTMSRRSGADTWGPAAVAAAFAADDSVVGGVGGNAAACNISAAATKLLASACRPVTGNGCMPPLVAAGAATELLRGSSSSSNSGGGGGAYGCMPHS